MKFNLIKQPVAMLFALLITSTGCLKDKAYNDGDIQSGHGSPVKAIAIGANVSSQANFVTFAFDASPNDTMITILTVTLGATEPAQQDIHVTLKQNDSLLEAYNDSMETEYEPLPNSGFENTNPVVTIPKGSYVGYLTIHIVPDSLFVTTPYALAFSIVSVAESGYTISGNLQNGYVAIGPKNLYDGKYTVTGTMVDYTNSALTGYYPLSVNLVTIGPNTNKFVTVTGGIGDGHAISSGGGLSYYGSFQPAFTIDPVTNKVTSVVNTFGQPAGNGRSAMLDPSGINTWYPDTKTLKVSYFMLQPGSNVRSAFNETFTYKGPR